jgi:hypothetical protein
MAVHSQSITTSKSSERILRLEADNDHRLAIIVGKGLLWFAAYDGGHTSA